MINANTKICCIIGNPVGHSLSPQMHNAAFTELSLNYVFTALKVTHLKKAVEAFRTLGLPAVVVTVPHKMDILKYVDGADESAAKIGAANLIINRNGRLTAYNTDWTGALKSLKEITDLKGKKVALLGAGGAARALVFGLKKEGSLVSVFNRTRSHASQLKEEFCLEEVFSLTDSAKISENDIIVNTTSVGMEPDDKVSPIADESIRSSQIVFDIVYTPHMTKLLSDAKKKGAAIVHGYKMVLYGGTGIFEQITGKRAPVRVMEEALLKNLK